METMEPINLRVWGAMTVKREAIYRQVNPEQKIKMDNHK